ncbi:hypothetical protein LVJ94_05310 [Pendulispora rubella]|uniref:Uncharacterized protein n=1 Tax=Pendulispora rubella TaxID=2741070 RepID=A0ABZ2LNS7_9BACT
MVQAFLWLAVDHSFGTSGDATIGANDGMKSEIPRTSMTVTKLTAHGSKKRGGRFGSDIAWTVCHGGSFARREVPRQVGTDEPSPGADESFVVGGFAATTIGSS